MLKKSSNSLHFLQNSLWNGLPDIYLINFPAPSKISWKKEMELFPKCARVFIKYFVNDGRTRTMYNAFKALFKLLTSRLTKKCGISKEVKQTLNKMFGRHFQNFDQFCNTAMFLLILRCINNQWFITTIYLDGMTIHLLALTVQTIILFRISHLINLMF